MAEQEKIKTGSITYKQVERAVGKHGGSVPELWEKIGRLTGAGVPGLDADGNAAIGLTGVAEGKLQTIDKWLADAEASNAEAESEPAGKGKTGKEK